MAKKKLELIFSAVLLLVAIAAVAEASSWTIRARLFPWIIGIPLTFLCAFQFLRTFLDKDIWTSEKNQPVFETKVEAYRTLHIAGWFLGFFLLIWLAGFLIAAPLIAFLYLKLAAKEKWIISLSLSLAIAIIFLLVFYRLMHLPFSQPYLQKLLFP